MRIKFILSNIFIILFASFVNAQTYYFEHNAKQNTIYNKISALQLNAAYTDLLKEVDADPTNLSTVHLANYIDFYELFFNEDATVFKQKKLNQAKRLNIIEKLPNTNAYKLYSQGVINFQWALVKLKFKDYLGAAQDLRKSYLLLNQNKSKFPNFTQQQIYIGAIETVVGTIPSKYRWLATIMGLKGNIKTGISQVNAAMQSTNKQYAMDVLFVYVYVNQYFAKQPKQVWDVLQKQKNYCSTNRLLAFMVANIALNQNKATEAINALAVNKTQSGFLEMPLLDYELGCAYLYKADAKCVNYLQQFIKNSKGKFYIKDAYYKLCMYAFMQGNIKEAELYRLKINTVGNTETDADKNAQSFYSQHNYSTAALIKARFLCDGGFYTEALAQMQAINIAQYSNASHILEYNYRMARIYTENANTKLALEYYKKTISLGANNTAYFAARAALECGQIYEADKNIAQAIKYYNLCISLENHEYKTSLDQQAKAGLQRLGQ